MLKLDQEKIKHFYNNVSNVWGSNDPWHEYSQEVIRKCLANQTFFKNSVVLNAGSAGNTYNIDCELMYHVDIANEKIKHLENAIVASIENLPFKNNFFDSIICVGSVLNYCDALKAISELARVLKTDGHLILEFESSWGFEYLGKEAYKKDACIITTEYIEKQHMQWLYSPKYIFRLLNTYDLRIRKKISFHIIDGILSKFINDRLAISLTRIDSIFNHTLCFKNHGNNVIYICVKI